MADRQPDFSRMSRKQGNKKNSNRILNILIGLVVLMILVVGINFILSDDKDEATGDNQQTGLQDSEQAPIEPIFVEDAENEKEDLASTEQPGELATDETNAVEPEVVPEEVIVEEPEPVVVPEPAPAPPVVALEPKPEPKPEPRPEPKPEPKPESKPVPKPEPVKKTIVNPDWKPIGTKQTGEHASKYDGKSDDWIEKKKAIAYATQQPESDLNFWRIQNGGSPQKAEGIVATKDNSKKFKVYLEWVDGQGWKPVKVDLLK